MTQAKHPIFATLLLIGGCFFLLAVPTWVVLPILGCTLLWCGLHLTAKGFDRWPSIRTFVIEFLGFCCLVICFTGTMVAMFGLMFG